MVRLSRLRSTCDHGNVCPTLYYQPDSDEFLVQGYAVTEPHRWVVPAGETVVQVPTDLLPELQRDPEARDLFVRGREVDDVGVLTELALPPGECVVRIRSHLLPQLREGPSLC